MSDLSQFSGLSVAGATQRAASYSQPINSKTNHAKHAKLNHTEVATHAQPLLRICGEATVGKTVVRRAVAMGVRTEPLKEEGGGRWAEVGEWSATQIARRNVEAAKTQVSHLDFRKAGSRVHFVEELCEGGIRLMHTPRVTKRLIRGAFTRDAARKLGEGYLADARRILRRSEFKAKNGFASAPTRAGKIQRESTVMDAVKNSRNPIPKIVRFLSDAVVTDEKWIVTAIGGANEKRRGQKKGPGPSQKERDDRRQNGRKPGGKGQKPQQKGWQKQQGHKDQQLEQKRISWSEKTNTDVPDTSRFFQFAIKQPLNVTQELTGEPKPAKQSSAQNSGKNTCGWDAFENGVNKFVELSGHAVDAAAMARAKETFENNRCKTPGPNCGSSTAQAIIITAERTNIPTAVFSRQGDALVVMTSQPNRTRAPFAGPYVAIAHGNLWNKDYHHWMFVGFYSTSAGDRLTPPVLLGHPDICRENKALLRAFAAEDKKLAETTKPEPADKAAEAAEKAKPDNKPDKSASGVETGKERFDRHIDWLFKSLKKKPEKPVPAKAEEKEKAAAPSPSDKADEVPPSEPDFGLAALFGDKPYETSDDAATKAAKTPGEAKKQSKPVRKFNECKKFRRPERDEDEEQPREKARQPRLEVVRTRSVMGYGCTAYSGEHMYVNTGNGSKVVPCELAVVRYEKLAVRYEGRVEGSYRVSGDIDTALWRLRGNIPRTPWNKAKHLYVFIEGDRIYASCNEDESIRMAAFCRYVEDYNNLYYNTTVYRPVPAVRGGANRPCEVTDYVVVPRLDGAAAGDSDEFYAWAAGRRAFDSDDCWFVDSFESHNCRQPEHYGFELFGSNGFFEVWADPAVYVRPLTPRIGPDLFPHFLTPVLAWRNLWSKVPIYVNNSHVQSLSVKTTTHPFTEKGIGLSMPTLLRAASQEVGKMEWLNLHPDLATVISGAMAGALINCVQDATTPSMLNLDTPWYALKMWVCSDHFWSDLFEATADTALFMVLNTFLPMGGFRAIGAMSLLRVAKALGAKTVVLALLCLLLGPNLLVGSLWGACGPVGKAAIFLAVAALTILAPGMHLPAIAVLAKWDAVGKSICAIYGLFQMGNLAWVRRDYIARKLQRRPRTTTNPFVHNYQHPQTPACVAVIGGAHDPLVADARGISKVRVKHDTTSLEQVTGYISRGGKIKSLVDVDDHVGDSYVDSSSAFSQTIQARLLKKPANAPGFRSFVRGVFNPKPGFDKIAANATAAFSVFERSLDKAESTFMNERDAALKSGSTRLLPYFTCGCVRTNKAFRVTQVHKHHADCPHIQDGYVNLQTRTGTYMVHPWFAEWYEHLTGSKKRQYSTEIARIHAEGDFVEPEKSDVEAEAMLKIEIMPFLKCDKGIKGRVIQYMKPKLMVWCAFVIWKMAQHITASFPEGYHMTSGMSVDEYSDFVTFQYSGDEAISVCANGDDNVISIDEALLIKHGVTKDALKTALTDAAKAHARDPSCHVKEHPTQTFYCSASLIEHEVDGVRKLRHYPNCFKALYKTFVFIPKGEWSRVIGNVNPGDGIHYVPVLETVKGRNSWIQTNYAARKYAQDIYIARYLAFTGDPFMEPICEALVRACHRDEVLTWNAKQRMAFHESRFEEGSAWRPGIRKFVRDPDNDALAWDSHESRTGIDRNQLQALRDEIVEFIKDTSARGTFPMERKKLQNEDVFLKGLASDLSLKTTGDKPIPPTLTRYRKVFVESDQGSYDASTTLATLNCVTHLYRKVTGRDRAVDYCQARESCKVKSQGPDHQGSWVINGQMMSGWPDTTLSNSISNMLEVATGLQAAFGRMVW